MVRSGKMADVEDISEDSKTLSVQANDFDYPFV